VKNNAQYWIVDAPEVLIAFRDRDHKVVRTEPASLTQTRLRPGAETSWEYVLPKGGRGGPGFSVRAGVPFIGGG
jgi:hypothetical protein